jgi:hypothetical protein
MEEAVECDVSGQLTVAGGTFEIGSLAPGESKAITFSIGGESGYEMRIWFADGDTLVGTHLGYVG